MYYVDDDCILYRIPITRKTRIGKLTDKNDCSHSSLYDILVASC